MLGVIFLGLVSFFSDISSEMVYPLIPLYLTAAFGATPALVGVIEGIAESLASLLKVASGYFTDKYRRKKPVAFLGYTSGIIYKLALIFATSWGGILGARVIDRIGKGIRTAPRDVLVSECAEKEKLGKAFGVHKALDMAGSAIGILIAFFFLASSGGNFPYKKIFLISVIPAVLGLLMFFFVREKKEASKGVQKEKFWKNIRLLHPNLKLYLFVSFLFTLGNSSNAFLLLRAKSTGFTDTNVILLYLIYNVIASIFAIPFGKLSDRIGRKKILVSAYLVFSAVYFGFAFAPSKGWIAAAFAIYGLFTALSAGAERAFITEISPEGLRGTMLGLQSTLTGIALLPASAIAGLLWDSFGEAVPFLFGATLSLLSALILITFVKTKKKDAAST